MNTVHAIYENGVFRPLGQVDLPDRSEVEFEPRPVNGAAGSDNLDRIYALLSLSFETGCPDLAARHDEYQP